MNIVACLCVALYEDEPEGSIMSRYKSLLHVGTPLHSTLPAQGKPLLYFAQLLEKKVSGGSGSRPGRVSNREGLVRPNTWSQASSV